MQCQLAPIAFSATLLLGLHSAGFAQKKEESKGQPPRVTTTNPMAVELGKSAKVKLRGLKLDEATEIRFQEPHTMGKLLGKGRKAGPPAETSAQQVGDTEIEIELNVPAEIAGGDIPFTIVGSGGESKPYRLQVNEVGQAVGEKEPNNGFREAQAVPLPSAIEGVIEKPMDVDVYQFEGKKGMDLTIELQASRFGSALDGSLALYDDLGHIVAAGDDSPHSADPILHVKLPKDGIYRIALIDARDQGGTLYRYRLLVRPGK